MWFMSIFFVRLFFFFFFFTEFVIHCVKFCIQSIHCDNIIKKTKKTVKVGDSNFKYKYFVLKLIITQSFDLMIRFYKEENAHV